MERDKDIDTEQDPVTAVGRKEEELTEHDLNRGRGGIDLAQQTGRMNRGGVAGNAQSLEAKKEEEEKFESAIRQLLLKMQEALDRRLEELDRLIAVNKAEIKELKKEIESTETLLAKQFGQDWREKLKRGDLDLNDRLIRQWLMQQQQLSDYLQRHEKLIKERGDLEKQIAEIEGSNLPDHLKLEKLGEILESGTSAGVHKVWQNSEMSEQVRQIAGITHTEDYARVATQESGGGMFAQFAGISFAGKAGIGEGIEAKAESIKSKFADAAEPSISETSEPTTSHIPIFKGPKVPG